MFNRKDITVRETTDKGDFAKALEDSVMAQYVSTYFYDVIGSTRFSRREILHFSLMEILKVISKINSLREVDKDNTDLPEKERVEIKILWSFKQRMLRNICTLPHVMNERFQYMYALGLKAYMGMSRDELIRLSSGYKDLMSGDNLGLFGRLKRRITGNVLYPE